ncbi:MAG: hypothetical protein MZV70_55790 [Desulfobacterales bacterium]|nr:hypothetical protein [Desulfobacterales bacterium]
MWQSTVDGTRLVPAIYLCFWKVAAEQTSCRAMERCWGTAYTLHDSTFEANWDKVNNS